MIDSIKGLHGFPGGVAAPMTRTARESAEVDELLGAWMEERGRSVERLLVLGRVRRLLARVAAEGRLTERSGREARRLLRVIEDVSREGPPAVP